MKWKTKISVAEGEDRYIRGLLMRDLIERHSFVQVFFLLLRGRLPKASEEKMLNAMFVAVAEHGVEAPSAFVARSVASVGTSFSSAVAAGVLAIGEYHGGAIDKAAELYAAREKANMVIEKARREKKRIPGLGHKVYKSEDPRTAHLFRIAQRLKLYGTHVAYALTLQKEFVRVSGKSIALNVDGALAALLLELGFDPKLGKAFFIFGRLPGLIAHIYEEITEEEPYRRIDEADVEYLGVPLKKPARGLRKK